MNYTSVNDRLDLEGKTNNGSINACKRCSGLVCCGMLKEGGKIEPPFLTKHDIRKIEHYTGLKRDEFALKKKNPNTGNTLYIMKTTRSNGCVFFDSNDGKCKVYSTRPIDCRLFPLDIEFIKNKYYWALFKYGRCDIDKQDFESLLKFKDEALQLLGDELHEYATYPVPGMSKIGYKILMEVEF